MFCHADYDGHERIIYARDADAGLSAIIAIHSTAMGPAFGGCRMSPYATDAAALSDALRLSRGMTYKAAICGLPYGGGKSVIIGDPRTQKTEALLRAMGRFVETLAGRYIIADDVGTTLQDLTTIRLETRHTAAATTSAQQPLATTAYGVFSALRAAALHVLQRSDLSGLSIAVQGLGNVGLPLCDLLHNAGARLVVTDLDRMRVEAADACFGATAVAVDDVYDQRVDIFAPCALGAVINDQTVRRLKARIVCGGANNQLAAARHDAELAARNITYIPDYLAGAGGVIDFHQESIDDRPEAIMAAVDVIGTITRDTLVRARESGHTPAQIGEQLVRERLSRAARTSAATPTMPTSADHSVQR